MSITLGINRDELCSSIRSVYGEIDADIYLRRFFDMEFSLPDIDPEAFCKILIERYQLEQFFTRMSETTGDTAYYHNFEWFSSRPFPALCSHFGLSLRDIDYCVRMIVFIGKNVTAQDSMSQPLLSLLVVLRLKNKTLYQEYIRGDRMGSEVVNYIDKLVPPDNRVQELEATFDELEIDLYLADRTQREGRSKAMDEFARLYQNLKEERATPHTVYLSERTQKSDTERIERLNSIIQEYRQFRGNIRYFSKRLITRLSGLIELSQSFVRA